MESSPSHFDEREKMLDRSLARLAIVLLQLHFGLNLFKHKRLSCHFSIQRLIIALFNIYFPIRRLDIGVGKYKIEVQDSKLLPFFRRALFFR